jgi:hypothetical protein
VSSHQTGSGRPPRDTALAFLLVFHASFSFAVSSPNAGVTPGAVDPRVSEATVGSTICLRGYTATVRNVSTQTKHAVYVEYGISRSAQRNYVIDHLVPLEVGGANDIRNLWPEPKSEAKTKDRLEGQMRTAVVVHPGAFCAPEGDTGVTTAGTAMVCGPASDGRNRWHSA